MHERPFPPTRPWQLSACARRLVEEQRKNGGKNFSFKAFIVDLVPLLQESMSGEALTACFVCMSQAPDNVMQSKIALDFGEVFAKLNPRPPRQAAAVKRAKLVAEAEIWRSVRPTPRLLAVALRILFNGLFCSRWMQDASGPCL